MTFKINARLFKSDFADSKTPYYGDVSFKASELRALGEFLTAEAKSGKEYIDIKVKGWKRESKNGKPYISIMGEPPEQPIETAAASLANATDGVVVQADVF